MMITVMMEASRFYMYEKSDLSSLDNFIGRCVNVATK